MSHQKNLWYIFLPKESLLWGIYFILFTFSFSLLAYYIHLNFLHEASFSALLIAFILLFHTLYKDFKHTFESSWLALIILAGIVVLYFSLRIILHRFDFSVGDPSDYYLAGVCSITYHQDIGFFLPLTASISAVGYAIFGLKYAPFINILVQLLALPLSYMILRKLNIATFIALLITMLITVLPLNIWFSSTSFSDPIWQICLLIYILLAHKILSQNTLSCKVLVALFLLLVLVPFLRGEAVLYFALIGVLSLYHFWQYGRFKTASLLMFGLIVLSLSIQTTLEIRSHYLLQMQFSRVIPGITKEMLLSILYGASFIGFVLLSFLKLIKKQFQRHSFTFLFTTILLLFKFIFAYYYSQKEDLSFSHLLILNEYGFTHGNFGLPLTLLIFSGLILLYIVAFKGNRLSFLLILVYTIFYIPFIMQKVTFFDPHAFLYYWNRYYLSALMMIHLFALAFILQAIYTFTQKHLIKISKPAILLTTLFITISAFSLPLNMYKIVLTEPHQKNASILVPWMKKHVGNQPISIVYDSTIIYKQNKGHIGTNHIKYLISRLFSVFKIHGKDYQGVSPTQLDSNLTFRADLSQRRYVLCVAKKPCKLQNSYLHHVTTLTLPLSWREHYSLHTHMPKQYQSLSHSYKNKWELYFDLYRVSPRLKQTFAFNKTIALNGHSPITRQVFPKGWYTTRHDSGAWSLGLHSRLFFPFIKKETGAQYNIKLRYYLFNATPVSPRTITFSSQGKILKKITTTVSQTKSISLPINTSLLPTNAPLQIDIDIDDYDYKRSKVKYGVYIESFKITKH